MNGDAAVGTAVEGGREEEGFGNEKSGVDNAGGEVLGLNIEDGAAAVTSGFSVVWVVSEGLNADREAANGFGCEDGRDVPELKDANGFFGTEVSEELLALKGEDVVGVAAVEAPAFWSTSAGLGNEKIDDDIGAKGDAAAGVPAGTSVFSAGFAKENGDNEVAKGDGAAGASVFWPVSAGLAKEKGFEEPPRGEGETVLATGFSAGSENEKGGAEVVTAGASTF